MATTGKSGEIGAPASLVGKEQETNEKPLCFVISRIGEEGSPERARADKVLRHVIEKPLDSKYRVERADEIGKPGLITVQIIQRLASAELVVADLSGGNPNVYYELALRHYFAKPVVQIIERGQKAPFDVSPMRYVEFDLGDPDSLDDARGKLLGQVEAMEKGEKVETLVQVAEVFAEAAGQKGNETQAMLAVIYGALGDLQEHVSKVAVQVVDSLRGLSVSFLGGPLGIGNRATVPFSGMAGGNVFTAVGYGGRLNDPSGMTTAMVAGSPVGIEPTMLTARSLVDSSGKYVVSGPMAPPMNEQAKEEGQKRKRGHVSPSGRRRRKQQKSGDEKK